MKSSRMLWVSLLVLVLGATPACSQNGVEPKATGTVASAPAELREGEQKFTANCSLCHGVGGIGTTQGPPLFIKSMSRIITAMRLFNERRPME